MAQEPAPQDGDGRGGTSGRQHLMVSFGTGAAAVVVALLLGARRSAPLIGWDVLAIVFCGWVWAEIWPLDADGTASHAGPENPGRQSADLVLLAAAGASLLAVGVVLFGAEHAAGNNKYLQAALALVSVFVSWALVHTIFTLKYAHLYYSGDVGGVDFNEDDPPRYIDFAYLSFTVGMTFQVSDTNICSKEIRRTVLRHAWISFPLGAVILAASINLVSGLAK